MAIGDEEDRNARLHVGPDPSHDLRAGDVGQVPVQDQEIEGLALQLAPQGGTFREDVAVVPDRLQSAPDEVELIDVVVQCGNSHFLYYLFVERPQRIGASISKKVYRSQ